MGEPKNKEPPPLEPGRALKGHHSHYSSRVAGSRARARSLSPCARRYAVHMLAKVVEAEERTAKFAVLE